MGWIAVYKDGTIKREGDTFTNDRGELEGVGRPVQDGKDGKLVAVAQEDYGHKVAIDLLHGVILIDYEELRTQNGSLEAINTRTFLWICEGETNIVGEYAHVNRKMENAYNCFKTKMIPWYKCPVKVPDQINGEIECDSGSPEKEPGRCDRGHPRLEGTREVPCDRGSTKPVPCENGHPRVLWIKPNGTEQFATDIFTPLTWRPIWFTRNIMNALFCKVIGAQTTTPSEVDPNTGKQIGNRNIQKKITLFPDGRVGID